MLYICLALAAVILVQAVLASRERTATATHHAARETEWAGERARLVAAVKAPNYLPLPTALPTRREPPPQESELHKIGTINLESEPVSGNDA